MPHGLQERRIPTRNQVEEVWLGAVRNDQEAWGRERIGLGSKAGAGGKICPPGAERQARVH